MPIWLNFYRSCSLIIIVVVVVVVVVVVIVIIIIIIIIMIIMMMMMMIIVIMKMMMMMMMMMVAFKGAIRDLFTISSLRRELSPTRTLKWPRRNHVQITCNTSSAYHVQHVLRATWYEGTAQLLRHS